MPRGTWTAKDEREYRVIRSACLMRGTAAARRLAPGCELCAKKRRSNCSRIAAATVNKRRSP